MQPAMQNLNGGNVNRSILELKKKIQLSEGRRKALFEESQSELRRNVERIRQLAKEVAALRLRLRRPITADGTEPVRKCNDIRQRRVLSGKRPSKAAEMVQMQVNDLHKKLDILRYQSGQANKRLRGLADELKALRRQRTGSGGGGGGGGGGGSSSGSSPTRHVSSASTKDDAPRATRSAAGSGGLENRIHRLELGLLEADHVRRKYLAIRQSLLDDANEFDSAVRRLEEQLRVQEAEIARFKARTDEACALRDATRAQLARREAAEARAARVRTHQLHDLKSRVEQRRAALSRLERFMFPPAPAREDSQGSGDEANEEDSSRKRANGSSSDHFDTAFSRLKTATGAADVDEVMQRFLAQNETRQRLAYLRRGAEDEKKRLLKRRDSLLARLDGNKFPQAKEDEPDADLVDVVSEQAAGRHDDARRIRAAAEEIRLQLVELASSLRRLCAIVAHLDATPLPEDHDADLLLRALEHKVRSGLALLGDADAETDAGTPPPPPPPPAAQRADLLFPQEAASVEATTSASASEDDSCPTRPFLKRQAQLIVDAKSRRKTLRAAAMPKAPT